MKYSLFIKEEGPGWFRQYESIYALCLELSRMGGVDLRDGHHYDLDLLVPFKFAGPDLFDVVQLEEWFKSHVGGPGFKRLPDRSTGDWWEFDKKVQKEWRDAAIEDLSSIVGHVIKLK